MSNRRGANLALGLIAAAALLLEWLPGVLGPYGWFIDEFYYIACANHLAWGYVDHPPFSIAVLAAIRALAGDSLLAIRFAPALAGGLTVVVTGLIARRLGAGTFGQALAALAMASAGVPMVIFSFYSMNAIDLLLWALLFRVLVEIELDDQPRLWLLFGSLLGLGLMNKHTIVLLPLGLVAGMLLTRARRHFLTPWFWGGMAVAAVILLPNLLWQARTGWPSIEFYINADFYKNNPTPPLEVVLQQVLFMNPLALPIWLGGLLFLLGRGAEGRLRHVGWLFLLLLVLLALGQKSRPDRLTPAYAILFAAGGAVFQRMSEKRRWLKPVMLALVLAGAAVFIPVGIPLFQPAFVGAYGQKLGIVPQIEAGEGKRSALPQWLSDRRDWEALVDDVARVVEALPAQDRASAVIVAPSYGQAGALELLGRGRGLPPVYATHNTYALWGPPPDPAPVVVFLGFRRETLEAFFEGVEPAALHHCTDCTPWRNEMGIWIARGPKRTMREFWTRFYQAG